MAADRVKLLSVNWFLASSVDIRQWMALVSWHCIFRSLGHLALGVWFQIKLIQLFCQTLDLLHVVFGQLLELLLISLDLLQGRFFVIELFLQRIYCLLLHATLLSCWIQLTLDKSHLSSLVIVVILLLPRKSWRTTSWDLWKFCFLFLELSSKSSVFMLQLYYLFS